MVSNSSYTGFWNTLTDMIKVSENLFCSTYFYLTEKK